MSDAALIDLARNHIGAAKLAHHGFKKEEVDADATKAILAGAVIAELTCESYKDAIAKVPLYQLFDFFDLPKMLVDEEVQRMRSG